MSTTAAGNTKSPAGATVNAVVRLNTGSPGNPGITFGLFTWLRNTTFEKPGSVVPEPAAPVPAAAPARYATDAVSTSAVATAIVLRDMGPLPRSRKASSSVEHTGARKRARETIRILRKAGHLLTI